MAARKRTQEEKNLRTLRELAALPANKQCFDCHQRGPTYVNMTVGSFICTSCSGMLRGLNPPHRVKSITMTVFTPEEIEFIRNKGNEYCRYVWLGTYDTRSMLLEPEPRDEQKVKDFMIQKYERKRWYVEPDKAIRNMQDHINAVEDHSHRSGLQSATGSSGPSSQSSTPLSEHMPETKPLSNLLGRNAPPLVVQNSPAQLVSSNSWVNPNHASKSTMAQEKSVDALFGSSDFFGSSSSNQTSNSSSVLGSSQATPQTANSVSYSVANGNFANFESAFNDCATPTSKSFGMFSPVSSGSASSTFSGNAFETTISPPPVASPPQQQQQQPVPTPVQPPPADRYAALADLDSLFHQEPPKPATPPAPVSSWVGTTSTTVTLSNNNNNSSSLFGNQQPNSIFAPPASANPFTSTTSTWSSSNNSVVNPNQAVFANPFQTAAAPVVANPSQTVGFGQFGLSNQGTGNGPMVDNYTNYSHQIPPVNMQPVYFNNGQGLVGSPNGMANPHQQNGGLAYQWGTTPTNQITTNNGWGMVTGPTPGQIGAVFQNPKILANTGLGPQSVQMPANPFMSNAVSNTPRSNPSNPFL